MPENYQDPLTRFYANHRDALSRAHRALLGGIHDEAVAFTEEHPEIAHDPGMEDVRKMPPNEHLAAVKRIHAGESAGPEPDPDSNEGVDGYLKLRNMFIKSGERNVSRREKRAALRR